MTFSLLSLPLHFRDFLFAFFANALAKKANRKSRKFSFFKKITKNMEGYNTRLNKCYKPASNYSKNISLGMNIFNFKTQNSWQNNVDIYTQTYRIRTKVYGLFSSSLSLMELYTVCHDASNVSHIGE